MDWWHWILIGLGLLLAEMLTPAALYALFFGIGALVVGGLAAAGIAGGPALQWLLFSIVSVASLRLFRSRLVGAVASSRASGDVDSLLGEIAVLQQALPEKGVAKAELRGTTWSVRSADGRALQRGERCRVERIDGLTLWVRAE